MTADMHTYLIEPTAPLVIRSGRPFDDQAGVDEARFPPPSTLAGALRSAYAESAGKALGAELSTIPVAGPLPVKLGVVPILLVPKPADALYFYGKDMTEIRLARAEPKSFLAGEGCDLPGGLLAVSLQNNMEGKPASGPRWWSWDDLLEWRNDHAPAQTFNQIKQNGWSPPVDEIRTHVGIQRETHAAESSKLYQTAGLSFWQRPEEEGQFPPGNVGLIGRIGGKIAEGVITLGGERRLSVIRPDRDKIWPAMPDDLPERIRQAGGLTLTLLTPALFEQGWLPPKIPGLTLRAAALDRWQPHSGWDLAVQKPRAGRKLVPSGAVYWYALDSINDAALAKHWLTPISDHEQDKCDGFGLALPQPWQPID